MLDRLDSLTADALRDIAAAADPASLDACVAKFTGKRGAVAEILRGIGKLDPSERGPVGRAANEARAAIDAAAQTRREALVAEAESDLGSSEWVDATLPPPRPAPYARSGGTLHPISQLIRRVEDVCLGLGFDTLDGPWVEDDYHNFTALNIPPDHPARDPIDNFYVDDPATTERPRMLRSQTSTVQIREMERVIASGGTPPIKIVSPGRVYRPDTVDATHSFMFHQLEGLYIDRDVSMADLKSTLLHFARSYFGEGAEVRLRPSFFPFTEPSAEFDMKIALRPDRPPEWVELGGCGMVDPNVLEACGLDPDEWSGFAFGFGIERIAMGKYGIPDIRLLFENDIRFLSQL